MLAQRSGTAIAARNHARYHGREVVAEASSDSDDETILCSPRKNAVRLVVKTLPNIRSLKCTHCKGPGFWQQSKKAEYRQPCHFAIVRSDPFRLLLQSAHHISHSANPVEGRLPVAKRRMVHQAFASSSRIYLQLARSLHSRPRWLPPQARLARRKSCRLRKGQSLALPRASRAQHNPILDAVVAAHLTLALRTRRRSSTPKSSTP